MITYGIAEGEDVYRVAKKIEDVNSGESRFVVAMACLVIAFLYQDPKIKMPRLVQGVKGASEWITCFLAEPENEAGVTPVN